MITAKEILNLLVRCTAASWAFEEGEIGGDCKRNRRCSGKSLVQVESEDIAAFEFYEAIKHFISNILDLMVKELVMNFISQLVHTEIEFWTCFATI